ncbi:uncharacterized protein LOC126549116 isoform X2 [Aphis gossypii]|uniref:uncharacterized protein LOC126549116 isoform X2 n=1 Tax=Aphis gossypii TaxID=80765 RepID=UPI00215903D3|nr:uncharacterized protein LOC126549116 isoform X2 [Aphis gossypii]
MMIFINYNLQMYSIKLKYINGNKLIFMLFYLYIIEGPLVNNKDLYDLYLANPITIDEYKILRKPIPLYHETMYSIYSLRLQILGYIPLHENIWTEEMIKLRLIPNDCLSHRYQKSYFINIWKDSFKSIHRHFGF